MKIAVFGTGMVGNAIGSKLIELGHQVKMGSRTPDNAKAAEWVKKAGSPNASQGTFADAAAFGEMLFNCTAGLATMEVLKMAGAANLKSKVMVDIANTLDFSKGRPPFLAVCNTDSLGEQIQRAYPDLKVVKSLNTMNCNLMVNPSLVKGEHDVFLCGNDAEAKKKVTEMLKSFGWKSPIDLGEIISARGTEMMLPVWLSLWGVVGSPNFNFKIVK
jgi:8-hydroxy-5-deazaflavin:NADPH oxidoreductase